MLHFCTDEMRSRFDTARASSDRAEAYFLLGKGANPNSMSHERKSDLPPGPSEAVSLDGSESTRMRSCAVMALKNSDA
jgi:hypothetical protein